MAPCVLWMDEIEKGVASNDNDGGESRRLLGTLLTWMAERKTKVFLVATSNDIEALPPELVRKGRLDEIFFVDLPDAKAREEIFRIHLKRRKQDAATFDLPRCVAKSEGFLGRRDRAGGRGRALRRPRRGQKLATDERAGRDRPHPPALGGDGREDRVPADVGRRPNRQGRLSGNLVTRRCSCSNGPGSNHPKVRLRKCLPLRKTGRAGEASLEFPSDDISSTTSCLNSW
jgi:hypothetical protein